MHMHIHTHRTWVGGEEERLQLSQAVWWNCFMQQIPEEIERLMVGIQAYLSIRRRLSDIGLAVFEDMEKIDKLHNEQVFFLCS